MACTLGSIGLTEITRAAPVTRRIWPITTLIVIVAFLLMAYQLFVCALLAFSGFAAATHLLRRYARHTELDSAA